MPRPPRGSDVAASINTLRLLLRVDNDRTTTVALGRAIAITASRRGPGLGFPCAAVARLTHPHGAAPPPHLYFTDLDHAHRFAANTGGQWLRDRQPLARSVPCIYQLIRSRTTIPLPAGAPVYAANLDHLVQLAAYWYETAGYTIGVDPADPS